MSGTYTIGGGTANFSTITAAIDSLVANGICGPVVFSMANGTYNEEVTIPAITGSSATNTITFKGANGNASIVDWKYSPLHIPTNFYGVLLNGASYITFQNISIILPDMVYAGNVVDIRNNSSNISFVNDSLSFQFAPQSGYTYTSALIMSDSSNHNSISITGCNLIYGGYGIVMAGTSAANPSGNMTLSNNIFYSQLNSTIQLTFYNNITIYSNNIKVNGSDFYYAVSLTSCNGTNTIENNIMSVWTGGGISLYNCNPISTSQGTIANNFISNYYGTAYGNAIVIDASSNINVYYNSICLETSSASGVNFYSGSNIRFVNNCIYGGSAGISINTNSGLIESNYNNLYSSSFQGSSAKYYTLAAWVAATGFDSNSISVNPNYNTFYDLHIITNVYMHGKGIPIAGITTDIDGTTRSATHPDMGADEFNDLPDNAALQTIIEPTTPECSGTNPVIVTFANNGSDTIKSVIIYWSVNNVKQTPYTWTGALASASTSTALTIGNYNFTGAGPYSIKIWVSQPNGIQDTYANDDTARLSNITVKMTGTYTIGGLKPDYTTFSAALADLSKRTICGPVVFNVRSGFYLDEFNIGVIQGASATNTITFQSEVLDSSMVTLYNGNFSSVRPYLFELTGTRYFTFRYMTFAGRSTNPQGIVLMLINGARHNSFEHDIIYDSGVGAIGSFNSGAGNSLVYIDYGAFQLSDSNTFTNDLFINGAYAIYDPTEKNAPGQRHNWTISHNVMKNQTMGFVELDNAVYPQIAYNYCTTVDDTLQKGSVFKGISASKCSSGLTVTNNTIVCDTGYGIYLTADTSVAGKPIQVYNNMVSMERGTGLSLFTDSIAQVYFNSVAIRAKDTISYDFDGFNVNMRNNIFANLGGGKVFNKPTLPLNSNYNDLYTTGKKLSTTYATFAAWKAKGEDVNSDTVAPGFLSGTNLHILSNPILYGTATATGVKIDIDSLYRGNSPDIGAAQFPASPKYDIGITALVTPNNTSCHGSPDICIAVKNFGAQPADSIRTFTVYTQINGTLINTFKWNGLLNAGASIDTLKVAHYMFQYGKPYSIKIWTAYPNYSPDANNTNDTVTVNNAFISMGGTYTIGGYKADFDSSIQVVQTLLSLGVCDSVHFKYRPGQYHSIVINSPIPGSSANNTVTFSSEMGDSLSTLLADSIAFYTSTATAAGTLSLTNVSNVRLEHMALEYLPGTEGSNGNAINCIYVGANCNNITVAHNHIEYNVKINGSNCLLQGNYLDRSKVIFYGNNSPGNKITGNIINTIDEDTAFSLISQSNYLFKGNIMAPVFEEVQEDVSLYMYGCASGEVSCNKFFHLTNLENDYAVYMALCNGTAGNPIMFKNNYIEVGQEGEVNGAMPGDVGGIQSVYSSYVDYYQNSMITDSSTGYPSEFTTLLYIGGGQHNNVMNNMMLSVGPSKPSYRPPYVYPFWYTPISAVDTSDYNLYYTNPAVTMAQDNSTQLSLSAWQDSSGMDLHSQIGFPDFVHDTAIIYFPAQPDLNIYFINPDLSSNGLNPYVSHHFLPQVSTDIYGHPRNNVTPMIGAYEYNSTAVVNNASVVAIDKPTLNPCSGTDPVTVTIANYGTAPLTAVTVQWQMDGVTQTPFNWTGNLAPGDSTIVTIGNYNFSNDSVQLKTWTILPNGKPDAYPRYDTVSMKIFTSLNGTYTVGGTAPDFATPLTALAALIKYGVCGPVILNIRDGQYRGALNITPIRGTTDINTVTFQSENHDSTRVILIDNHNTSLTFTVEINGAEHIRFRQLHVTADNPRNQIAGIFKIYGGSNDIILANNIIEVNNSDSTSGWGFNHDSPVYMAADNQYENPRSDSVKILNNYIERGTNGVYFQDVWSFWQYANGLVVSGNTFWSNQTPINIGFANSPIVTYNNITADSTDGFYVHAINMHSCIDSTNVSYNNIYTYAGYGIGVTGCVGSASAHCKVYNNTISTTIGIGISATEDTLCDYYYNSIYSRKTGSGYSSGALSFAACTQQTIKNNIVLNLSNGWAVYDSLSTNTVFDHNDYCSPNSTLFRYNSVNYNTLAAWQAATHSDSNSFTVNPAFVSNGNLHFTFSGINHKGIPVAGITTDINGKLRNLTSPDMGCYEENLPPLVKVDAGISSIPAIAQVCVNTGTPVKVRVKNFGPVSDTLQYVTINWTVNNVAQPIYTWTGIIPADSTSPTLTLANYNFKKSGSNQLKIWTSSPNLFTDTNHLNDTMVSSVFIYPLPKPKLGNDTAICNGDSLILNPGSFSKYVWSPVASTNSTYTVKIGGVFYVTVTDSNGCVNSDTVIVNTNAKPTPVFPATAAFCQGLTDTLYPGVFTSYAWSTGSTNSKLIVTTSNTYKITVTNSYGCSATDSTVITVNPIPPVPTITQKGDTLTSSAATGNQWYINGSVISGATNQIYVASTFGSYYVVVTNSFGCTSQSASVVVTGINELSSDNGILTVYPNPSSGLFNIDIESKNENIKVKIYNVLGGSINAEGSLSCA